MNQKLLAKLNRIVYLGRKVFCATGPGGGVDPTCGSGRGSGSGGEGESEGGFKGKPANPKGLDTHDKFRNKDGSWTKERQALHDEIVKKALSKAKPVDKPVAYMMGGGPASGKSVAQKSGEMDMPENIVVIDPDELKKEIPEYGQMLKAKDTKAAAYAHEESSYLSKRILKEATEGSYNTLLDGTGDSSLESVSKKVKTMREGGKKVVANYVTVDTETAVQRNIERAKKTGRLPPETMLRNTHREVSKIVPEAIKQGLFDEFNLFDTNTPGKAIKVASAKGKELTIHDKDLWARFLAKANE